MSGNYEDHFRWNSMKKTSEYHPGRNQQIYKWKLGIIIQSVMLDHMQKSHSDMGHLQKRSRIVIRASIVSEAWKV